MNEMFDNITILLCVYILYFFTQLVPDASTRSIFGWVLIVIMSINIVYRLTQAIIIIIK